MMSVSVPIRHVEWMKMNFLIGLKMYVVKGKKLFLRSRPCLFRMVLKRILKFHPYFLFVKVQSYISFAIGWCTFEKRELELLDISCVFAQSFVWVRIHNTYLFIKRLHKLTDAKKNFLILSYSGSWYKYLYGVKLTRFEKTFAKSRTIFLHVHEMTVCAHGHLSSLLESSSFFLCPSPHLFFTEHEITSKLLRYSNVLRNELLLIPPYKPCAFAQPYFIKPK